MKINEKMNFEKAVSPVIATILMVAITVVLSGVLYVWASNLAESNTGDTFEMYSFTAATAALRPLRDGGQLRSNDDLLPAS